MVKRCVAAVMMACVLGVVPVLAASTRTTFRNHGRPWPIPGVIETENFDIGTAADPAYFVPVPGNVDPGPKYRRSRVSIGVDTVLGLADVDYIQNGEWVEATATVAQTGLYDLGIHIATPLDGRTLHVDIGGVNVTGTVAVPNTGCYGSDLHGGQCFADAVVQNVPLAAGPQRVRVTFDVANGDTMDYLTILPHPGGGLPSGVFTVAQTPFNANDSDAGTRYELGVKFTATRAGVASGLRYWKGSRETGAHVGHLWDGQGRLLATARFAGETMSGWQTATLAAPLALRAGATYVVSVNSNGYFASLAHGLDAPLAANGLATVTDGTGSLFGPPGKFPAASYANTNYFRDVVFAPAP